VSDNVYGAFFMTIIVRIHIVYLSDVVANPQTKPIYFVIGLPVHYYHLNPPSIYYYYYYTVYVCTVARTIFIEAVWLFLDSVTSYVFYL